MEPICVRINKLISVLGINQATFAKKLRIASSSVSTMCSGKTNPSGQTITAICREWNVNEDWLRTGNGGDENMFLPVSRSVVLDAWLGEVRDDPDGSLRKQVLEALSRMKPEFWHAWADFCEELVNIQEAERSASPEDPQQPE